MWTATDLIAYFQPVDHPLQAMRDQPDAVDCPRFTLHSIIPGDNRVLMNLEVYRLPGEQKRSRQFATGGALAAGALLAGAILMRKPRMLVRAVYAGVAAGAVVFDLCQQLGDRFTRAVSGRKDRWVAWSIGLQDMVFTFADQQIHVGLPTVLQVAVRNIHERDGAGRSAVYSVQLDLEDGRLLPLYPFSCSEAALDMARQVAHALNIPVVMQPISLDERPGKAGLILGPTLYEPGLN